MGELMERTRIKRLEHISSPLPDGEVDAILTQLDLISDQLDSPSTAGERAMHAAEQWGWKKYLEFLGSTPHLPSAEQTKSTTCLVNYFCAIRASGGINQYSPRALREYFLNAHLEGTLLTTVNESVARRNAPPQK